MPRTLEEIDGEVDTLVTTQEQILERVNQLEIEADTRLDELELWRKETSWWKTPEFWGTHVFAICSTALSMDLFGPTTPMYKGIALAAAALSVLGYGMSTGLKKNQNVVVATDAQVERRVNRELRRRALN